MNQAEIEGDEEKEKKQQTNSERKKINSNKAYNERIDSGAKLHRTNVDCVNAPY